VNTILTVSAYLGFVIAVLLILVAAIQDDSEPLTRRIARMFIQTLHATTLLLLGARALGWL
jgi:integral membrane sensor domain MASE1